jgi:uncharacterized membrane protein
MTELIVAVLAFLATHAVPAVKPVRRVLVASLGEWPYMGLYSLLSLGMIGWLGFAYARAPYVEVWAMRPWMLWVPVLVMPFSCLLLVAALSSGNPLSVAPSRPPYDPSRPGIVSLTRHPLMWAFILWSAAHLVPNGDVASLILFGLLTGLGLLGPLSLDAKRRATLGESEWRRLAAPTSNLPMAAVLTGRTRLDLRGIGPRRLGAAAILYGLLIAVHPWVIGVSPLPL